jgi:hypothetical protein
LIGKATEAEQNEPLGIRYIHADVTVQGALGEGGFDAATCNFGLSDIDDLDAAITAVSAALRAGGSFVFSTLHPCFAGGKDISGSWPAAGSYYDEGHWTAQDAHSTLRRQVGANHRMLSTYLGALLRHGLWLDQLAEPLPQPGWDPLMMPTASPSSSSPARSSFPQPDRPHGRKRVTSSSPGRCRPDLSVPAPRPSRCWPSGSALG